MNIALKLAPGVPTPAYATSGSAAVDLIAHIPEAITLRPGEQITIPSGVSVDMTRHPGLLALLLPRSGLGTKGLVMANTVGLIDNDYHGPIDIQALNRNIAETDDAPGAGSITITPGMRIAQLVFMHFAPVSFDLVEDFETTTERGAGGFGSTGS